MNPLSKPLKGTLKFGVLFFFIQAVLSCVNFDSSVVIISDESKSETGAEVKNEIRFFETEKQDIWMMNQTADGTQADRLLIIVDKSNNKAEYFQLEPGPLEFTELILDQKKEFKVSCFICHANGPRAIRPNLAKSELSLSDKLKVYWWNFKMKKNGLIQYSEKYDQESAELKIPFKHKGTLDNQTLDVEACTQCHNGQSRTKLRRQHMITIKYMLETQQMPPKADLSPDDKNKVDRFLKGF